MFLLSHWHFKPYPMHKSSMPIKTAKYSLGHVVTKMQKRPVKQTTFNGVTLCDLTSNRIEACLFLNSQLSNFKTWHGHSNIAFIIYPDEAIETFLGEGSSGTFHWQRKLLIVSNKLCISFGRNTI